MKRTSYRIQQIELICKAISKIRAMGRCQLLCGREATESHHVFFGKWLSYWQLWTNHFYYVALCNRCHQHEIFSPHHSDKKFLVLLEDRLKRSQQEEQWTIIKAQHTSLYDGTFLHEAKTAPEPDYKAIHKWLVCEWNELEETCWMDQVT